ncbi:MAG: transcription elongation factor GreA [Planctomycetota bacterium]|jgi:transcription elongation factor GreA
MPAKSQTVKRLVDLAQKHDLKPFENAWAEAIANDSSDVEGLLEGIYALETQGHLGKAATYINMLLPCYLDDAEKDDEGLQCLHHLSTVAPRDRNLRDNFLKVLRRKYADNEGLETLIEHSGILEDIQVADCAEKLESYLRFKPGSYVEHPAGWGVGTVASVDTLEGTVTIDFFELKGHELGLDMARSITKHLERSSYKAMKFDRIEDLQTMAKEDPVSLVKCVVTSRERKTTVRDLRERLTEGVIPTKDWSKWWAKTRTKAKRDSNVKMTTGNNPTVEVTIAEQNFEDQTLINLRGLRTLPRKIKYVRELFIELTEHPETRPALMVAAGVLAKSAAEERDEYPGAAISLALMLEKIAAMEDNYEIPDDLLLDNILADPFSFLDNLATVPINADRKEVLARIKDNFKEDWQESFERALYLGEADICEYCSKELLAVKAYDRTARAIEDFATKFRDLRGSFVWYVKLRLKKKIHKELPLPSLTSLLEKTILLHSHCMSKFLLCDDKDPRKEPYRKECKDIEKLLVAKKSQLLRDTLDEGTINEASGFYNIIRGSRSLPDDVKDILVATLLRARPEVAKRRAEAEERKLDTIGAIDENIIYVTNAGYLRYEDEYNIVVNDEIPKNATEITRAASFGDLSENAEWTAALEKQSALTARAEEMKNSLDKARIIDADSVNNETVAIGCEVRITNLDKAITESYTLLGPWDADMDKHIISYMAPLGRGLLGQSLGAEIEVILPSGSSNFRIEEIAISPVILQETNSAQEN